MVVQDRRRSLTGLSFSELEDEARTMVRWTEKAIEDAYTPHFGRVRMGATAWAEKGGVSYLFPGSNVEHQVMHLGDCAEDIALAAAQSRGQGDACKAVAIMGKIPDPEVSSDFLIFPPCDLSRGRMWRAAERSGVGENFRVLLAAPNCIAQEEERLVLITTIRELEVTGLRFDPKGIDVRTLLKTC